jgi:hypothetical protein
LTRGAAVKDTCPALARPPPARYRKTIFPHAEGGLMTVEQFRNLLTARPFQPFIVHLPDGRAIPVIHHDFAIISPSGRTAIIYQRDDSFNIVDLMLVADLEVQRTSPPAQAS